MLFNTWIELQNPTPANQDAEGGSARTPFTTALDALGQKITQIPAFIQRSSAWVNMRYDNSQRMSGNIVDCYTEYPLAAKGKHRIITVDGTNRQFNVVQPSIDDSGASRLYLTVLEEVFNPNK